MIEKVTNSEREITSQQAGIEGYLGCPISPELLSDVLAGASGQEESLMGKGVENVNEENVLKE